MKHYFILFFKGARFKTWPASLTPFLMAGALAFKKTQALDRGIFVLTGLSILLIQITVNLFNDAIDGREGLDDSKTRLGPRRLAGSGQAQFFEVQGLAFLSSALALLLSIPLIWKGGGVIALAGLLSLLMTYFYTGSSYSLLKLGLSEIAALVFFGFFIVCGVYYLQTLSFAEELFYLSLQCGFWSLVILLINHLRDEKEDSKKNRKHFVTLYGRENTLFFIVVLQGFTYLLCFYWINSFPLAGLFPLFILPLSCVLIYQLCVQPVAKYNTLLAFSAVLYSLFGGVWILGLLI